MEQEKKSTNIQDRFGLTIHEGDNLLLEFESIKITGKAQWSEDANDWELFEDKDTHVGLEHNKDRIRII